jgi:DNA mismatch repair protein MutS
MITTYRTLYTKYQALYGDDTCIFLLVGKFYELYDTINPATDSPYTSILRAARIMNVQVSRKEDGSLFAGVPEQTRDKFAQTLTSRGWTVVIVDQVKNAGNKVIDRVTARILSPGTHVEMAGQERMSVAAVYFFPNGFATSVNDLTTGEVFSLQTTEADSILHMYQIYNVTEVVAVTTKSASCVKGMFGLGNGQVHCFEDSAESDLAREEFFGKMFKVRSLMPIKAFLGIPSQQVEKSLLFLLRFVEDHFPQQAERLTSHTIYNPAKTMRLSNNIIEQLNIITGNGQKSILDIADHTFSSIGKRALRERILRPITDSYSLQQRWNQVEWCLGMEPAIKKLIERDLKGMYDLPRLHFKIACASINATDILQLFQSYGATYCLIENLADTPLACPAELKDKILAYKNLFTQMFDEGKAVKKSQGEVVGFLTDSAGPLSAAVEREIQEIWSTWNKSLKDFAAESGIPFASFTVELGSLTAPRNLYASLNAKKFTGAAGSAGASGFLKGFSVSLKKSGPLEIQCDAFTSFTHRILASETILEKVLKEEYTPICDTLWDTLKPLSEWISWIGDIDCTFSLATVSRALKWSKPTLGDLNIQGLRHPLLEAANTRSQYVSHSVAFDTKGWLIYGVNASGKSSLMKATGIAVILAQAGSFVPATSMSLRPYDAAFSRIWTHDNIWAGLSSFAVEVTELSDILRLATDKSLVLGDEVCSGTESSSATALVAATIEALQAKRTHFMFATHLHDLLKVPGLCEKVAIWHLRVITQPNGKLVYDRSLQPGSGSSSYGLEVAKAMGLPFEIIQRAHEIRRGIEGTVTIQDAPKSRYNSQIQRRVCEMCGSQDVRQLEVHHIDEQAKGGSNKQRNLAVLCERCHDDHHNKKIEVAPLTQTSEGLERIVSASAAAEAESPPSFGLEKYAHVQKPKGDSNTDIIKQIVLKHPGKPAKRISSLLQEEHGIKISPAQLKRFM